MKNLLKRLIKKSFAICGVCSLIGAVACSSACVTNGGSGTINESHYDETGFTVGAKVIEEKIDEIEIHWTAGSVTIIATDEKFSVSEDEGFSEEQKLRIKTENGKLTVRFWKSGHSESFKGKEKNLTLRLPKTLKKAEIITVSAGVSAKALCAEETEISSVSGGISLNAAEGTEIKLSSVSGKISVGKINAEEIFCGTVSGKIETGIASVNEFKAESVSGSVHVALAGIDAENAAGATVGFSTTSGKFDTQLSYANENGKYIFGDGKTEISVNTVSGSLFVK